jgi:hypothetical protein
MQKIKRIFKSIQMIVDDKLGNPFIYNYQKTLLKLTIVLIIAVFVVIKGCTAPLLIDNKVMRFFFCSNESGDKTMYYIGISILAAYIFYYVQVYIPERTRCKKRMNAVTQANIHQIFILEQFIKAWSEFLGYKDGTYFCDFKEFEYTTNHGEHILTKKLYEETVEELTDNIDSFALPKFDESDSSYQELMAMLYIKLDGFKRFLLDTLPLWSENPLESSKSEYMLIKNKLKEFLRYSKRLQNIEKYVYTIKDEISLYNGKIGEVQKLAEALDDN